MYAVIEIGSGQYKVAEGDIISVNRLPNEAGDKINIDKVLLYSDGKNTKVGQPYLKNVKVSAQVIKQTQGDKLVAFKFRRRKASATKKGHRQQLTALSITKVAA